MLLDTGCSGVLAPVFMDEDGGTRLLGESRSKLGMEGSIGMEPSVWRSRSLMSKRLTYLSIWHLC
jgi:hypothetical protein